MAVPVDVKPENDRELVIARRVAASPEACFRAWTDPKLIPEWFCPKPWRAEVQSMDVRAGGASKMTFHGPDGESFPNDGVYLEVTPGRKLVFTDAFTEGWRTTETPMFVGVITFEDAGNGETLYTARARHWTDESAQKHREMGFHEGWGICAEQMEALARGCEPRSSTAQRGRWIGAQHRDGGGAQAVLNASSVRFADSSPASQGSIVSGRSSPSRR